MQSPSIVKKMRLSNKLVLVWVCLIGLPVFADISQPAGLKHVYIVDREVAFVKCNPPQRDCLRIEAASSQARGLTKLGLVEPVVAHRGGKRYIQLSWLLPPSTTDTTEWSGSFESEFIDGEFLPISDLVAEQRIADSLPRATTLELQPSDSVTCEDIGVAPTKATSDVQAIVRAAREHTEAASRLLACADRIKQPTKDVSGSQTRSTGLFGSMRRADVTGRDPNVVWLKNRKYNIEARLVTKKDDSKNAVFLFTTAIAAVNSTDAATSRVHELDVTALVTKFLGITQFRVAAVAALPPLNGFLVAVILPSPVNPEKVLTRFWHLPVSTSGAVIVEGVGEVLLPSGQSQGATLRVNGALRALVFDDSGNGLAFVTETETDPKPMRILQLSLSERKRVHMD